MAREITDEGCRPEAVIHVATVCKKNLIAQVLGIDPIPESELLQSLQGQGITSAEIARGMAALEVMQLREASEEQARRADMARRAATAS